MNFLVFIFALSSFVVSQIQGLSLCHSLTLGQVRTAATCGNASDAVPLYLASSSAFADNLYDTTVVDISNNVHDGVYTFEGVVASVFITQELSTVPLFQQFNPSIVDHFYTIDPVERDNALSAGYLDNGIAGFVYPSQICGSTPFFGLFAASVVEHYYTTNTTTRASMLATGKWSDEGITAYVLNSNPCA
ncbi:hypothetical protein B0H16DRAFT_1381701 [Mycena metata]|uniref:DUF5648 domain-containing protein n=1 Tax=Mycena metata TaxID=1033252 RepID=A0AAD7HZV0_9AGAR|nr:hypothetical protein B0H16DRAFT_1381701 [Mycena metata]